MKWIISLLLLLNFQLCNAQIFQNNKKPLLKVRKVGPYLGIQQSRYFAAEFGAEMQFKEIKLIKPKIHAINMGFDYNFSLKEPVLSYALGYWFKQGRVNLTYGANLVLKSNFDENRFGGGPVIGFKLLGFHLQTGYHFLTAAESLKKVNQLFISLRYSIVNTRDYTWRKRDSKKK
ncbi:MAG: hypothetical protein ACPGU5_04205 [Lishizhenia sp.]